MKVASVNKASREPIHERHSDMYGEIKLYAPSGAPETWAEHAWRLTTSKGPDGPLKALLKAENVLLAFERPHFIEMHPQWLYEDDADGSAVLDF